MSSEITFDIIRESFKDIESFLVLGRSLLRHKKDSDYYRDLVIIDGISISYIHTSRSLLFYFAEHICCKIKLVKQACADNSFALKAPCEKQVSWHFGGYSNFSDGGLTEVAFKKLTEEQQKAYIKNMDIFT